MKLQKKFLLNYRLTEDIEKHETLNPLLWNSDNTLKPEVEEKINLIVDEFVDGLVNDEVKIEIKDIKLVGSNCSYNYTKDSDLDIHIECDTEKLDCPDNLYPKLYSAYRSIFNNKLDIDFYGIPVELYVETEESTVNSNGIYSVMAQKWLKEPTVESIPEIDQDALNAAFEPWEERYNDIMNRAEMEGISAVKDLQEDFDRPKSIIADQIKGEWDAIKNYHAAADDLSNIDGSFDNVIDTLNSIADEEEVHVGELTSALSEIDDNVENNIEDGQKEYADDNAGEQELTESVSTPLIDDIDKLIEDIYELRKIGIAEGGEYDNRNLLFKEFRNKGYLDNLKELKNKLVSKELSLKEQQELEEDTEKVSDHKWVNKGKEGTHGTFKTKKEADAQRKAMFANGFSEDLETEEYSPYLQEREELIKQLLARGQKYDFNRLSNATMIKILEKPIPKKILARQINQKYEPDKYCDNCGKRFSDSGDCPYCDQGEEDLDESMDYGVEFKRAIHYVKQLLDNNPKIRNWSYNDYHVEEYGIWFQVQFDTTNKWREDESILNEVIKKLNTVSGISCSKGWGGDWEYYFTVKVRDKRNYDDDFFEEALNRKNVTDIKRKFTEVLGGGYQPLIQESGRFDFYNLRKNDADYIVNMLQGQDFIEYIQKNESGKYNFNNIRFNGMPEKYYNVYGQIKQQYLYEDISNFDYEAFVSTIKEMDKKNPQKALDYVYRDEFKPHIRIGRQESTDYKGYDSYTNYIIKDKDNKYLYTIRIDD